MDKIIIQGGTPLKGVIKISGAKNAALPLMTACLLTDEDIVLSNLPHLMDISTMANLLVQHGVDMTLDGKEEGNGQVGDKILLNGKNIKSFEAPYDIVRKMRASVLVLGPLLARFSQARVSLPGGCAIGTRPIDMHLDALEAMGAKIDLEEGYINASVDGKLKGATINFDKVSVGATENILMAATLAEGTTVLKNAAREPEIVDLADLLIKMGADIKGAGSEEITVNGVQKLKGAEHSVVADRIEAGTYAVAASITGGKIELTGVNSNIMESTIEKLKETGTKVIEKDNSIIVDGTSGEIKSVDIITEPHPGFPTDMQAQFMALLAVAHGKSAIEENIFENRFMHVSELSRMGANINIKGNLATVTGSSFKGAQVMATDLRASVCLVLAALAAKGETVINRVYHIDRGYERVEEKLSGVGANIKRVRA